MKKIAFVFLLSLLVMSCEKEEKLPPNPEWLNTMISQMESSIPGTSVTAYKWNKEFFYLVSNPISSCLFCTFYNYSGELVVWTEEKTADFGKNGRMIKVIWQKSF
jgi:hypothetical protein